MSTPAWDGFFPPHGAVWTVDRELAVLVGSGARALLLQVAHPKVAAAVVEHSRYATDPLGRLRHTLDAVYAFAFAPREEALRWVQGVNRRHARVVGRLPDPVGVHRAGDDYMAMDPDLLLWVYATLIDSSLVAYEALVAPLNPSDRESYYQEMRGAGTAWGIPAERFPSSLLDLRGWMGRQIASGEVRVGPQGREVARVLLRTPSRLLPQALFTLSVLPSVWLLPPDIRRQFGIRWNPVLDRSLASIAATSRAVVPRLPRLLRDVPWARRAERLLRRSTTARALRQAGGNQPRDHAASARVRSPSAR
ncbi:MAG TPA: oxygenase MpaB family protein [Nonomuraea sp.]|nr:oxygenase MpaB family protein [Nonomuraea sp.]